MFSEDEYEGHFYIKKAGSDDELKELKQVTMQEFNELVRGGRTIFQSTGADLLREAIEDWEGYSEGESFPDWFPEASTIYPDKIYRYDAQLENIVEVIRDGND